MPEPNTIVGKLSYVTKLLENPCDPPWTVYAEAAGAAGLEMFITLVSGGLDDVLRAAANPGRQRSIGHGTRRSRSRGRGRGKRGGLGRTIGGLLLPQELIGDKIGTALGVKPRRVTPGIAALWKIDGVIQRGLWFWLLADVIAEGAFTFTSQLYKSEACKFGAASAVAATGDGTITPIAGWQAASLGTIEYERNGASWNQNVLSLGEGRRGTATAFYELTNVGSGVGRVFLRARDGGLILGQSGGGSAGPGGTLTVSLAVDLPPGRSAGFELLPDGAPFDYEGDSYGQGTLDA